MERKLLFKLKANNRPRALSWSVLLLTLVTLLVSTKISANDIIEGSDGGEISGESFEFCVGDNYPDHVSGVAVTGNSGENSQWVVTDETGKILGLPPSPEAVNFDGVGAGTCFIWHLSYTNGLEGLEGGMNVSGLKGDYDFSNSVKVYRNQPDGGTLTGGPFEFYVDGTPDMVSGIVITGERSGKNSTFVITDEDGNILGIPPSLAAVEGIDFDGAGAGTCLIWHLRYEDGLEGAEMGLNANDLVGCYDLSNPIEVVRKEKMMVEAGELSGGPFYFCIDGTEDMVSGISMGGEAMGSNSSFVITDDKGKILGLPPTLEAVEGVNFDGAGAGTCLIWYLRYEDGLEGAEMGLNANDLQGNFDLSNPVMVVRTKTEAGTLNGGPFEFYVDGTPDMVSGIAITGERSGKNSTFVITDEDGNILGIPPSLAAVEGVDFDGAGAGTCLIWHLRYEDGLEGAEMGLNANDLIGCYDLSNPIEVVRKEKMMVEAGELSGGPFYFCIDGTEDMVSGISMGGEAMGTNSSFVITDDKGKILGLPPTLEAVEGVNFDGAGAGTCLIWYLRYEDGLEGAEMGLNANDLQGNFDLSNPIMVVRTKTDAGTLTGGPFEFYVDGTPDMVSGIAITGERSGKNSTFVITDEDGNILGIPPSLAAVEGVDFDGAGAGTCLIWHLRYEDGLEGAEMGLNANDLIGCYDLSNPIEVVRKEKMMVEAGELSGGPFYFCIDGTEDMVSGISMGGEPMGTNSSFVITDDTGKILGLPPTLEAVEGVNFDGAGAGTCLIWYLRYEDGLEGAEMGLNANDLKGDFDLSNPIMVVRTKTDAGILTGGPFEFYVDGTPDMVSGIAITGERSGKNSTFVITDEDGNILGIPPSLAAVEGVDFDGAGAGTCLIWHLRYEDGLEGAEMGLNANDLVGCYDLSNPIEVVRKEVPVIETVSKAYPIPALDVLNVSLPDFTSRSVDVFIFDTAGNPIYSVASQVEDNKIALNVQSVPGGLYLLRISQANGKTVTMKIVIK
ncbi:T9SS type A sorting domain-containing protein [Zobellia nedashkovskayae]|uniref:T9SS type A sorting domain-containing protein n=1 Tax=Zobellia nedashkovskayae TaxID=2779510 RepID=UPI00188A4014|nr:T9SS type A sorting domain-containing protein [Zobellia nedashkovskayae]